VNVYAIFFSKLIPRKSKVTFAHPYAVYALSFYGKWKMEDGIM